MGLLDRLRGVLAPGPTPVPGAVRPARWPTPSPQPAAPRSVAQPQWQWVAPGRQTTVAGYPIPGGLIYIGHGLPATTGARVEPALLDPRLPVDRHHPDWEGRGLHYWPSYDELPPASRAAYLSWLADGRRFPGAPIGYVFLFFYGLERRALVDGLRDPAARQDVPAIVAEVRRLLHIYGGNGSFSSYAGQFLETLDLAAASAGSTSTADPPPLSDQRWAVPMRLRLALGRFALTGEPVPARWARAWAWYHPQLHPRTPQTRCRDEFDRLFAVRYQQRFKDGLVIRPSRSQIRLAYSTASAGIGTVQIGSTSVPDVLERAATTRKLGELVDSVTNDLDAHSRWLGRNPQGRGSLAAAALLPPELLDTRDGQVGALHAWTRTHLAGAETVSINAEELAETVSINAEELIGQWPTTRPARMTKPEAVAAAQLLERLGVGIEPDVRFGGPALMPGPAVLFRTGEVVSRAPSQSYSAATTLLHLAVAVGQADGQVSAAEHDHLIAHIETTLDLPAAEQVRLRAHLRWLVTADVTLAGLRRRLDALTAEQRLGIADFVLTVAAADGAVDPAEVTVLTRIYRLLELDPAAVYGEIHDRVSGDTKPLAPPRPAIQPVVVRPVGDAPPGFALPTSPPTQPDGAGEPPRPKGQISRPVAAGAGRMVLDRRLIDEKVAETARVGELLSAIFADDDPTPDPGAPAGGRPAITVDAGLPPVAGLDAAHTRLLRELATAPTWTRQAFEDLAERYGVLPIGALEVLNEAAIEATGDPVVDGDDQLLINHDILQEMLG